MAHAESTIRIAAKAEDVMAVISDFEKYPEFLPEIRAVSVLKREGAVCTVQFELQMLMKVSYTLILTQDGDKCLNWELLESKLIKKNTGYWRLVPTQDGMTEVTYGIDLELAGKLPASVNQRMAGQALPDTLKRFKLRAESA